ncbi:hypothetical protein T439DRAFT_381095 [Meredithblackwellia eburnea MCA 4105]
MVLRASSKPWRGLKRVLALVVIAQLNRPASAATSYSAAWSASDVAECGTAQVKWTAPKGITNAGLYVYSGLRPKLDIGFLNQIRNIRDFELPGHCEKIQLLQPAGYRRNSELRSLDQLPAGLQIGLMVYSTSGITDDQVIQTNNFAVTGFVNITSSSDSSCLSPVGSSLAASLTASPTSGTATSTAAPILNWNDVSNQTAAAPPETPARTYTSSQPSSTGTTSKVETWFKGLTKVQLGGLIGGVVVVLLVIVGGVVWWCSSKRRGRKKKVSGSKSSSKASGKEGAMDPDVEAVAGKRRRKSSKSDDLGTSTGSAPQGTGGGGGGGLEMGEAENALGKRSGRSSDKGRQRSRSRGRGRKGFHSATDEEAAVGLVSGSRSSRKHSSRHA